MVGKWPAVAQGRNSCAGWHTRGARCWNGVRRVGTGSNNHPENKKNREETRNAMQLLHVPINVLALAKKIGVRFISQHWFSLPHTHQYPPLLPVLGSVVRQWGGVMFCIDWLIEYPVKCGKWGEQYIPRLSIHSFRHHSSEFKRWTKLKHLLGTKIQGENNLIVFHHHPDCHFKERAQNLSEPFPIPSPLVTPTIIPWGGQQGGGSLFVTPHQHGTRIRLPVVQ